MSDKISKDQVEKLARLARLNLSDEELEKYRQELSSILDYVSLLDDADTGDLKPTSQVTGLTNVFRKDEVTEQIVDAKELIKRTPDSQDNYIKVRRMF